MTSASEVGRPLRRDGSASGAAAGRDGATQTAHHWDRDQTAGWGDGKREAAAWWDGEQGLQPGWLLAGLATASPRLIKAAVFWAVSLDPGK